MALAQRDFDKGTEIATLGIGSSNAVAGQIDPPQGDADLRFVLHDYDCSSLQDAAISVEIQLAEGMAIRRDLRLGEITWPRAGHDCHPIGHFRPSGVSPFRISIRRAGKPLRYAITVTRAAHADMRLSVWLVYNDRDPVERMLGASWDGVPRRPRGAGVSTD